MNVREDQRSSELYREMLGYLEARLGALREKNDTAQPEDATNQLRGGIKEIKALIKALKEVPTNEREHRNPYE